MKNLPRIRTRFKNWFESKQGEFVDYKTGKKSTPHSQKFMYKHHNQIQNLIPQLA
jgi:hypothetical protein